MNAPVSIDMIFESKLLSQVVTLQEACVLWKKSPRQMQWAIDRDQVTARKSITSGTWLLTYYSVFLHFGEPVISIEEWMV